MAKDLWLPKGYELLDGSRVLSPLYSGEKWQIFDTDGSSNILITLPEMVQKWCEHGLIDDSLFCDMSFRKEQFRILHSHKQYVLAPVENGTSPKSMVDGLAFSLALKESRKLSDGASFHDAVYVEQYSRLLPSWTLTPYVEDEVVLGTWIAGGVIISTESFRRLTNLAGWMHASDLVAIINAAGFNVPSDAGLLAKRKPASQAKPDTKTPLAMEVGKPEHMQSLKEPHLSKVFKLPGRLYLEEFFNEHIIDIIFNAEKYMLMGIDFPSAIILHGPPGCGKTFAVERLVEFIDWPSYSIDSSSVGSPYIHETSKKISEVFDKAIDDAPSVLVIDEMESFLSDRHSGSSLGLHHVEEVAEFLRRIPEATNSRVLIIAMTNMIDAIDSAILRRGRFDHVLEVGMPSRVEVESLIDSLMEKLPKADGLSMDKILDALTGKALSDAAFVIRESARLAAKAGKVLLDQDSIDAALNSLPKGAVSKKSSIGFS